MCIICDAPDSSAMYTASDFVDRVEQANRKMREAEALLLKFLGSQTGPARKRYSRAHKALVRARRDWNRVEHIRNVEIAGDQRTQ